MKKMLFIMFAFVGLALSTHAQTGQISLSVSAADDTLTNADTATLSATINGDYSLTFAIKGVRVSGTAAGNVAIYGSTDGVNYVHIDTSDIFIPFQDYSLSNVATQVQYFFLKSNPFKYYQVRYVTSGTVVLAPTGYILYKSRT